MLDESLIKILTKIKSPISKTLLQLKETTTDKQRYFASSKEGFISFLPVSKIKQVATTEDIWTSKLRQNANIGRLVRAIYKEKGLTITDDEVEKFVNEFKALQYESDAIFKIVKGNEIIHWYNEKNYVYGRGTLNNSCMRYVDKLHRLKLYTESPDVEMLVLFANNDSTKIIGRAIVWHNVIDVQTSELITYMDRIYTVRDSDVNLFINYALKNNWHYKNRRHAIEYNGKIVSKKLKFNLKSGINWLDGSNRPYLDTFKSIFMNDSMLPIGYGDIVRIKESFSNSIKKYKWSSNLKALIGKIVVVTRSYQWQHSELKIPTYIYTFYNMPWNVTLEDLERLNKFKIYEEVVLKSDKTNHVITTVNYDYNTETIKYILDNNIIVSENEIKAKGRKPKAKITSEPLILNYYITNYN